MKKENGIPPTALSSKRSARGVPASGHASTLSSAATAPADLARARYTPRPRPVPVKKKLAPGSRGTKRFLDRFGERPVCVRYRYDEAKTRRYTTVKLIVEEKELLACISHRPSAAEPPGRASAALRLGRVLNVVSATPPRSDRGAPCRHTPWRPLATMGGEKCGLGGYSDLLQPRRQYPNSLVAVRVGYEEVGLRGQIKQASGKWDPKTKLWCIPYHKAMAIGLSDRIVEEQGD